MRLLGDARVRGASAQAIREAYIDAYGGFVLDLPPGLEGIEQFADFRQEDHPHQTAVERVHLLRRTIKQVKGDTRFPPEMLAELQYELGSTLRETAHGNRPEAYEAAIDAYEEGFLQIAQLSLRYQTYRQVRMESS